MKWAGKFWGGPISAVLIVAALFAATAAAFTYPWAGETRSESGEVVRFGAQPSIEGERPLILVKTSDGRSVQIWTTRSALSGCAPGSRIELIRQGKMLSVGPAGCREPRAPAATPYASPPRPGSPSSSH